MNRTADQDRFFELTGDLLAIIGPDGAIHRLNPAWERVLGWPRADLIGRFVADLVVPEDRPFLEGAYATAQQDASVGPVEVRVTRQDGSSAVLQWTAAIDRETGLAYVVARDVGPAKEAEAALRASEQRYRELFDSHPVPMAVWDPADLRILDANDAAIRQYGYDRQELADLTVDRLVHPEDWPRLAEALPRLPAGIVGAAVFRHVRKDGSIFEVEVTSHALQYAGRPARLVMVVDVTDKRRLEEQLREAHQMEAIGRLAGGIAHDFNNLLTAINGYGEMLVDSLPETDARRTDAEQIQLAGRRAAAITSQLLAFSRRQMLQPVVLDLNAAIRRAELAIRPVLGDSIVLETDLRSTEPFVLADPTQIEQVIINLAVNGADAMPDGGRLTIETADLPVDERAGALTPGVLLSVTDTGAGMDEAAQQRVFEPFSGQRGSRSGGLGLASVFGTVRQSGGLIRVWSEPGRGSTFRITFPRASLEPEPIGAPPNDSADGAREQGTILLVEDEDVVRSLARAVLEREGYTVLEAADGASALRIAADRGAELDILVTDVVMPGMSGLELARRLSSQNRGLPVLIMSGYAEEGIGATGTFDRQIGFLAKPFSPEALVARVRDVRSRARREAGAAARERSDA